MTASLLDRRGRPIAAVLLPLAMIAALGGCDRRSGDVPAPTTTTPPTTTPIPTPSAPEMPASAASQ